MSAALLASFLVAITALHTVVEGFAWWFPLAGFLTVVLTVSAVLRVATSRRWLSWALPSAAALAILTATFAPQTSILGVIPSFPTFRDFGDLVHSGVLSMNTQSSPATVTDGILFLLCVGVSALAVVADAVAVSWHRPALAAVPLGVIVGVPMFVGPDLGDVTTFVLTAICWLILLRAGQPHRQTARSFGLGAVAVVLALLSPFVLPPVSNAPVSSAGFQGYLTGVNPVLNLGKDLRRGLPQLILTYHTDSGEGEYLRLVSLQNFTAEQWAPDPPVTNQGNYPGKVGPPPGLTPDIRTNVETTTVDVRFLASPWLPVPYPATSVSGLRGDWFWNADDLTFTSPNLTARGEAYQVKSLNVLPTKEQLEASGDRFSTPGSDVLRGIERYLELPPNLPAVIVDTAKTATRSASSNYARAVALQQYFRDGNFEYSEDAPAKEGYDGSGMGMIAAFLAARSGYCIHFASAMAVMARTLGIPSRVAVGFLPGEASLDTVNGGVEYRVTTKDLHTWPELFFEGVGWVRFEPTPGRGVVPSYASPSSPGPSDSPSSNPTAPPTPTPSATRPPSPRPSENSIGGSSTLGGGGIRWLILSVIVLAGLLVVALIPAAGRAIVRAVRSRRLRRGAPVATTGWREILQSARDLGIVVGETRTPRESVDVLAQAGRLGPTSRAMLADALASVLQAVESEVFAPPPSPTTSAGIRSVESNDLLASTVSRVVAGLRSSSTRRARVRASLAPPSMWSSWIGPRSAR